MKAIYDHHATALSKTDWDTVFLSNHDNPRLVSNFGDTSTAEFRVRSAKLIETMLMTLRGTPFIYQGDELGMTNYPFTRLDQFNDIEVKNAYKEKVLGGKMTEAEFIAESQRFGRDNSRTPMQWSDAPQRGIHDGGGEAVAGGESELHGDQRGERGGGSGVGLALHAARRLRCTMRIWRLCMATTRISIRRTNRCMHIRGR